MGLGVWDAGFSLGAYKVLAPRTHGRGLGAYGTWVEDLL